MKNTIDTAWEEGKTEGKTEARLKARLKLQKIY
jgi:hypothetical protein